MLSSAIFSAFILLFFCPGIVHRKFVKFVTSYLVMKSMICHKFIRVVINVHPKFTKASHYICRLFDDLSPCSTMQHIHSMTSSWTEIPTEGCLLSTTQVSTSN